MPEVYWNNLFVMILTLSDDMFSSIVQFGVVFFISGGDLDIQILTSIYNLCFELYCVWVEW